MTAIMFSARTLQYAAKRASRSSLSSFPSLASSIGRQCVLVVCYFLLFLLFICSGTCMHIDGSTVHTWQYYWCSGRQGWAFDFTWLIDWLFICLIDLELEISNTVLGFSSPFRFIFFQMPWCVIIRDPDYLPIYLFIYCSEHYLVTTRIRSIHIMPPGMKSSHTLETNRNKPNRYTDINFFSTTKDTQVYKQKTHLT